MVFCSAAVAPAASAPEAGALEARAGAEGFAEAGAEADAAVAGCVVAFPAAACPSAAGLADAWSPGAVQAASAESTTAANASRPVNLLAFSRTPVALPRNALFRWSVIARITLPFCHAAPPGGAVPHAWAFRQLLR
jgi:hypothetical protein